jgi:hypothetical protein
MLTDWGLQRAGRKPQRLGTRASANTSGPDFTLSWEPVGAPASVKLRTAEIRTERRKPVSSAGPFSNEQALSKIRCSRLT